jgi:hypothetical protein
MGKWRKIKISINDAVEMINKRLKVFAKNSENPPTIKPEYVETIFKILKARIPIEVTFRDIIEEVEKHWMNHEFESLRLHEILDFNTLSSMMLDIESDHPGIKAKIDSIWTYLICPNGRLAKKTISDILFNFCLILYLIYFFIPSNRSKNSNDTCKLSWTYSK